MKIDGQFYFCEGCKTWQPFVGADVTCDCEYDNEFTDDEIDELEKAVEEAENE